MTSIATGLRTALLSMALVLGASSAASAQTLTFDDVSTNAAGINNNFTTYNGYQFFNFNVATSTSLGTGTNAVSGTRFALSRPALGSSSIGGVGLPSFNFFDAWLSFRQFDLTNPDAGPIGISVLGYRAGIDAPVFSQFLGLTNTAQLFTFNFFDVEEVVFETAPLIEAGRSSALALDNARLAVVPEPSTFVLLAIGTTGLLVLVRRKRRT